MVYGLRANPADRSNIAVYSTSATGVTLRVTALSGTGDGARVVIDSAKALPPFGWFQWSFDSTGLVNGSVLVEKVGGLGTFGAYGVVDDNVTNDGSIFGAVPTGALSQGMLQLPVLVETARFAGELLLANGGSSAARLDLSYAESLSEAASGTVSVTLAPGEQRIIPGAIDFLRRGGIPLGAAGAAGARRLGAHHRRPAVRCRLRGRAHGVADRGWRPSSASSRRRWPSGRARGTKRFFTACAPMRRTDRTSPP